MLARWKIPTNLKEKGSYIAEDITKEFKKKLAEKEFSSFEVLEWEFLLMENFI